MRALWGVVVCAVLAAGGRVSAQAPPVPATPAAPAAAPAAVDRARAEPGLADRKRRYARPLHEKIALVPAYVLRAPFQLVNYPVEHYLIHKDPGPVTVYTRRFLTRLGSQGVAIKLQGLGSGSGVGTALVYEAPRGLTGSAALRFSAAETYRGYDQVAAVLDSVPVGPVRTSLRLQYMERPQEDFFGFGAHSARAGRTTYQLDEWLAQAGGVLPLHGAWRLAADVAVTRNDVGRGRDDGFPTVLEVFPASLEGSHGRFEFFDWGGGLLYDSRDVPTYARHGSVLSARLSGAGGLRTTRAAYSKLTLEAQRFQPLPGFRRTVAVRARATWTENHGGGAAIPLFRMERVGGSRSLRGYQSYRFHDEDAMFANVEYRFPVWALGLRSGLGMDGVAFFDFGAALPQLQDIRQRDWHSGGGIGLRIVNDRGLLLKIDNAWSPEGYRLHFGLRGTF